MTWPPHITVAAIVHRNGQFLMVEEEIEGSLVINQPAGHLEPGETLIEAVHRETMEETGWEIEPTAIAGIYHYQAENTSFHRVAFIAEALAQITTELDPDITACLWLNPAELGSRQLRSPIVKRCIDDYLAGQRAPLNLLTEIQPLS